MGLNYYGNNIIYNSQLLLLLLKCILPFSFLMMCDKTLKLMSLEVIQGGKDCAEVLISKLY